MHKLTIGNMPRPDYFVQSEIDRLRVNVGFAGADKKVIMVTSSEPNEGKSYISVNLWNELAKAGKSVCFVDADMRNSTFCAKYGLAREDGKEMKGTSHYLSGESELSEVLVHRAFEKGDMIPNVENIVYPSMMLENRKFRDLLDKLAGEYRYVFVDAPPLGLVSDAERIGHMCDGAILCVRGGYTPKGAVRESVAQLGRAGCPLLGIVLNRVADSKSGYYHKYYGKEYGKYYGSN